jgi:predicted metalloprotease with PDZ domain
MPGLRPALLLVCAALLAVPLVAQEVAQEPAPHCPAQGVSYGISLKPAQQRVHVDAVTHAPAPEFQLPVWNALYEIRNFAVNVTDVKAYEGAPAWRCPSCTRHALRVQKRGTSTWAVAQAAGDPCVTFSYEVTADDPGAFGSSLVSDFAFFNWAQLLVFRPDDRTAPVWLRLVKAPPQWRVRDGGILGGRKASELASVSVEAANYDRLVDSPVMMGHLYERSYQQDGATYHIAVDSPAVDLDALTAMLQKITAVEVDWMQDRPFDSYSFLFLADHGSGKGAMEHSYSAAIDIGGERLKKNVLNAADYAAHEFFHLWNVRRIRPRSLEPVEYMREQDSPALWFSEGVTNTVTGLMLMRAGLLDEPHLLAHLASVIGTLESRSAHRSQSVEGASVETWLDTSSAYRSPDRSISYYGKGEILGYLIDLRMRRLTGGRRCLRDLFQYMNAHYARQGRTFPDSEGVRQGLEQLTGDDFRDFFARYVSGVDEIPYDVFFRDVGLQLVHRQIERAYAGFELTRAPGRAMTIERVDADSPAARLNLLAGDAILRVNGKPFTGDWNQFLKSCAPHTVLRLRIASWGGGARDVRLRLAAHKIDEYQFQELPGGTTAMLRRRHAFLRGEAEAQPQ